MIVKRFSIIALLLVIIFSCTSKVRADDTYLKQHYLPLTSGLSKISVVTTRGYTIEHQVKNGAFYIKLYTKEFENNKDGALYLFAERTESFRKMVMSSWPTPDSQTKSTGSRVVTDDKHRMHWVLVFNELSELPKLLEENIYCSYGKLEKIIETSIY